MALQERHRWIAANVAYVFGKSSQLAQAEDVLKEHSNHKNINDFLEDMKHGSMNAVCQDFAEAHTPQRKLRALQSLQPENSDFASELSGQSVAYPCKRPLPITELTSSENYTSVKQPVPKRRRRLVIQDFAEAHTPQRKRRALQSLQPENFDFTSELSGQKVAYSPVACKRPVPITELTSSEDYASVKQPVPKRRRRLVIL